MKYFLPFVLLLVGVVDANIIIPKRFRHPEKNPQQILRDNPGATIPKRFRKRKNPRAGGIRKLETLHAQHVRENEQTPPKQDEDRKHENLRKRSESTSTTIKSVPDNQALTEQEPVAHGRVNRLPATSVGDFQSDQQLE